jgi:hypothetical protein
MDLTDPALRWGIGALSGGLVAAVALLFLSGTVQLVALGMAVVDAVLVPVLLTQGLDG